MGLVGLKAVLIRSLFIRILIDEMQYTYSIENNIH